MDDRSYSSVMLKFANGLAVNDPLSTLYQLMSFRQPIAVKECTEKNWGDWRPHLAMILSNPPNGRPDLQQRSIVTLGDTLLEKVNIQYPRVHFDHVLTTCFQPFQGFLYAAHFCYLVAPSVEFGSFFKGVGSSSKLVLVGSDHNDPSSVNSFKP